MEHEQAGSIGVGAGNASPCTVPAARDRTRDDGHGGLLKLLPGTSNARSLIEELELIAGLYAAGKLGGGFKLSDDCQLSSGAQVAA